MTLWLDFPSHSWTSAMTARLPRERRLRLGSSKKQEVPGVHVDNLLLFKMRP